MTNARLTRSLPGFLVMAILGIAITAGAGEPPGPESFGDSRGQRIELDERGRPVVPRARPEEARMAPRRGPLETRPLRGGGKAARLHPGFFKWRVACRNARGELVTGHAGEAACSGGPED